MNFLVNFTYLIILIAICVMHNAVNVYAFSKIGCKSNQNITYKQ